MFNIFKYLKQYVVQVIIIILLLLVQADCDLALPQYTSDIIDVGISKKGIDEAAPDHIRESQLNILKSFFEGDDLEFINNSYEKTDELVNNEAVYKLTLQNDDDIDQLEKLVEKPVALLGIISSAEDSGTTTSTGSNYIDKEQMQQMMTTMLNPATPVSDRNKILDSIFDEFGDMKDTMTDQLTAMYIQNEYEAVGIDVGDIQIHYLVVEGMKMVGVSLASMAAAILVGLIASKVAAGAAMNLRNRVFRKVLSFSSQEMDKFSTASLITRNTNDIQQIQMVTVMMLRMVLYAPILGVWAVIKVLNTTRSMSWIILVAVIALVCLVAVLFVVAMPKFRIMQTLVDRVNLVAREILNGVPVIRAFNNAKHEEKRFDEANRNLIRVQLFTNRAMTFMMPVMMFIMNGISVMIIWFGAKNIDAGNIQVGQMMAFLTYTMQIIMAFLMITLISIMLPRAGVAANRIEEVLKTELTVKEKDDVKLSEGAGKVIFNNVTFQYPNAEDDVLENISFETIPGQTTAIIGSTGSGKSTLINLIPRFYDVKEGQITIDGVDIRDMSLKDLREQLGYVPQKAVLFSGTIESNIKFGKEDASLDEIKLAADIAQASDFIEEKEDKYESEISQGGTNVSGGQKQRISIARAIAKKPKVYIFDDSFSALDYKTDKKLRAALKNVMGEATVIIVAQRISTILNAEQIIVLDEGKIAGKGTHKELLKSCDVYKQIALSQLSETELNYSLGEGKEELSYE
jgi:ATP-binding cassette subfamily B multidrug efflux pump